MWINRRQALSAGLTLLPASGSLLSAALSRPKPDNEFEELTPESVAAIKSGMEWLKRTENRQGGHGVDIGQPEDIGCSAMTGLALLATGSTPSQGPHKLHLRRIYFLCVTVS